MILPVKEHFIRTAVMIGIIAFTGGCKPKTDEGQQLKTLDNFGANERLRTNQCRISEDIVDDNGRITADATSKLILQENLHYQVRVGNAALQSELMNELKIALTAVPRFSQEMFVALGGAVVEVRPDATTVCGGAFSDEKSANYIDKGNRDTIESCWLLVDNKQGGRRLSIVINATVDAVRHGTVRAFGYLHAQFVSRLRRNLADGAPFVLDVDDSAAFRQYKEQVAERFLVDMIRSKIFDLSALAHLLGPEAKENAARVITDNIKNRRQTLTGLSLRAPGETLDPVGETRDLRIQRFQDYVFAESYDSYYCRPAGAFSQRIADNAKRPADLASLTNSRAVMKQFFATTFASFENVIVGGLQSNVADIRERLAVGGDAAQLDYADGADAAYGLAGFDLAFDFASLFGMGASPVNSLAQANPAGGWLQSLFGGVQSASGGQGCAACLGGNCSACAGGMCGPGCSCSGGVCSCGGA